MVLCLSALGALEGEDKRSCNITDRFLATEPVHDTEELSANVLSGDN